MRQRQFVYVLLFLLCGAAAWYLWRHTGPATAQKKTITPAATASRPAPATAKVAARGIIRTNVMHISLAEWNTNKFAGRLSNTTKPIGQLVHDSHAILLENALIDTTEPLNFNFPKNLQSKGDPGAYIVQAKGPIDPAFRQMLAQMGATIVAYIPNDAYLIRGTAASAGMLGGNPLVQAVVPYEPYYKMDSSLLPKAVQQLDLPDDTALNLALYADDSKATISQIEKLGGHVVSQEQSPFGPVVRVIPPRDWTAVVTLPGVQIAEPYRQRRTANDLARATMGVAADSVTSSNYLGLTGSNILVAVDDTGIDTNHPDLAGRVIDTQGLTDTLGHGTHVAGIIAGSGLMSTTVTNVPGSIMPGTNGQFRGMAPAATLYSLDYLDSDQELQEAAAQTNALISNNSWTYIGANNYDLAAASYDAATRDALPLVTGSQPVLFVFAAGNEGSGDDTTDPGGGVADSIESPATAKDVVTVGAIQENRDITNVVTTITLNSDGTTTTNTSEPWQAETSTDYRVAGFSSRGNVGVGIEGTYGRFKPDVVAPGTFIVSTRSEQWDIGSYFYQDPTNDLTQTYSGLVVQPGSMWNNTFPNVPSNAVQAAIYVYANADSPVPFPDLPIYAALFSTASGWDFFTTNNEVLIPGSPEAPPGYLQSIISTEGLNPFLGGFYYGVSNSTMNPISFDLETDLRTTNGTGDYFIVLSNLDQSIGTLNPNSTGPGPYYRYESGTSMSAADVSGVLALMQEFYWNAYHSTPSPAMLKAMLINGAQVTSSAYNYLAHNSINYEGWGLVNLPDSLPPGITNQLGVPCSAYLQDQSSTNALATGDSQTFYVTTSSNSTPLRMTLAWTDPPGDPAAAIKLVNNLVLVVTNLSDPANPVVYYGNDFQSGTYNTPHATNTPPVFDTINNIQNVNLRQGTGTNFSVTVLGYRVNVNAVTTQSNNIVQDYALVISTGTTNSITVSSTASPSTSPPITISNPTGDQLITPITQNNTVLLNQFVGANSPLLGTNTATFSVSAPEGFGPNNWQVTVGQTNQWHFYVVTNSFTNFPNAAFVTFNPNAPEPDTASVPREGVFAGTVQNASRDADVDLYVSTDPTITNLNPSAISNCVILGTQVGASVGVNFANASLGRGTTEFVVDTNSQNNEVYYVGVKSEDQMSAEYGFISIFSATPFSTLKNGTQIVNGVPVPANIPDGSPHVPGKAYVFGLAIYPMRVGEVTVSNYIYHQNFGDLIGTLTLNGNHPDVLNNHDSFDNPNGFYSLAYDDTPGSTRSSDGPGSLNGFIRQSALGVWMLTEADNALTQTGAVEGFTATIYPHQDLGLGITNVVQPHSLQQFGYIDVPPGATNLTFFGENLTTPPLPVQMYIKYGAEPTTNNYDVVVTLDPTGTYSFVPPQSGPYFVAVYNPNDVPQTVAVFADYILGEAPGQAIFSSADTPIPIPDDAITNDTIYVPANQIISSLDVALAVQHPRISDLVFHLISPDGTRVLLMENRGGTSADGVGGVGVVTTNNLLGTFEGAAQDYSANNAVGSSGWTVATKQVSVVSDSANAYPGATNYLALANGLIYANLSTTKGTTYTLKLPYRGPGILGWWRGESNVVDSAYGNNGALVNSTYAYYTNGWVDTAFHVGPLPFGNYGGFQVPDSPAYILTNALTMEGWVRVSGAGYAIFWRGDNRPGYDPYSISMQGNNQLSFEVTDQANNYATINTLLNYGQWYHVAATYNNGAMKLYTNGVLAAQATTTVVPIGVLTGYHPGIGIGNVNDGGNNFPFYGDIDEISLYNRAMSASEVQAIYQDGAGGNIEGGFGKFDTNQFAVSHLQSLAEALLNVNGLTNMLYGDNTNWQTYTTSFTASNSTTLVEVQGIEPGMLFGSPSVTVVATNYQYLVFTENTNLTTTPIKFAGFPLVYGATTNVVMSSGFEAASGPDYYSSSQTFPDGPTNVWGVTSNQVSVVDDPTTAVTGSTNFLALGDGTVTNILPTVAGDNYVLTFRYRGPNAVSDWPADGTINDPISGNSGVFVGSAGYGPGYVGSQSFSFSGLNVNDKVFLGDPPNLRFTNAFTIEAWVYVKQYPAGGISEIFQRGDGRGCLDPYYLAMLGNGALRLHVEDASGVGCGFNLDATTPLPLTNWVHIAGTFDGNTGMMKLYTNGVLSTETSTTVRPFANLDTNDYSGGIAIGNLSQSSANMWQCFYGYIDDLTVYGRPLSAAEINGIARNGKAGKTDPLASSVAQGLAEAQVSVDGGTPMTLFGDNNNWQTKTMAFTAKQNGTPLQITGVEPGMLLDSFSLAQAANDSYYQPEESLDTFDGMNAQGPWTLEIQDDRAGATNPPPLLLNWQLRFTFVSEGTNGIGIPPGTTQTNVIPANAWAYYQIAVPTNADQATNLLVFATGPLNVWFNPANNPIGATPPDNLLIGPATNGTSILTTFSTPTNIVPGGVYYIGLQNTNNFQVTNGFEVNFHYFTITTINPGQPVTNTVTGAIQGDGVDYYSIAVPTNADYATNLLISSTQPVNVWFNQTKPPVCLTNVDYLLITNTTSGVSVLSGTTTPPLKPGLTYNLAVQNTNANNATYVLNVTFHSTTTLTNGVPTTNSVPTNSFDYYSITVPTNADYATNLLLFASAPVNVWFNQNVSPTSTNAGDYLLIPNATNGVSILSSSSVPPLVPGATYYLGIQNTNNVPVTFGLEVNFHLVIGSGITSGPTVTFTNNGVTNGILLTWFAQTNYHYQIQWTTSLTPPIGWTTIPGVVVTNLSSPPPVNGIGEFQYFDDGSLTGGFGAQKFYRLVAYPPGTPIPPALVITSVMASPGGLQIQWPGSTNYQYDVQWTTNLALPSANWNVLSNLANPPLSYTNGVYTFKDDGSLTGGSAAWKYFKVLLLP